MRYIGGEICTLTNQSITGKETLIEDVERVRIRDCHFGLTEKPKQKSDSLSIGKCEDVLIDQSVMRWSVDECLGMYDIDRLHVRDSLIYESLNDTGLHPTGGGANGTSHGCGALYWTRRKNCQVRFERVLFAHHNYRGLCNVGAKPGASVVSDFVNCVSFDCWNYYFHDDGEPSTDRNIRGCLFVQSWAPFKPSMWRTPGRLYVEDSWCIDASGSVTPLVDQFDSDTKARLVKEPFAVDGMVAARPAGQALELMLDTVCEKMKLDAHDVRVLGRIAAHKPGANGWTGVIDATPKKVGFVDGDI